MSGKWHRTRSWRALLRDRSGATAIEYSLLLAMIVVALLISLGTFGGATGGLYGTLTNKVVAAFGS
ncbi:hypothetical protein OPKNFCMD_2803 [Methylobacterium crusticola]|uniref:Flp family type IVb pilin n=1 Tax=Methylobacterium crusticola TaxID=1697972 RepID=A0ABQ4QXF1_9HYPH|nr:Flp family type IVb pilin [Methylobacterium crusticola]GJD50067.1 hypothetical protein OPKNFCMD_2803 [Methylobacterium crusticola]